MNEIEIGEYIPSINAIRSVYMGVLLKRSEEAKAEVEAYLQGNIGKINRAASDGRTKAELNPIINRPWSNLVVTAFEEAGYKITRNDAVMLVVQFIEDGEV